MQQTSSSAKPCPIALSLDRVGEWSSIVVVRDAFRGLTRFQRRSGIAPNILSRRLRGLVESDLLEKSRYNEHPPRDASLLTERGRYFRPVLWALLACGNRHFIPEGQAVVLIDSATGLQSNSDTTDRNTPPYEAVLWSVPHHTEVRGQP